MFVPRFAECWRHDHHEHGRRRCHVVVILLAPAQSVVNATGPFTDGIRKMDDPEAKNIIQPSAGVHIVLPDYYSPRSMGLLDPQTSDGRVIFFLPWEGLTIAGTTDSPCDVSTDPEPTEDAIQFILEEVRGYLSPEMDVRRGDVLAAWSGIRPLVSDPNAKDTQSLVRDHMVHVSNSGLVTIAGGKWTTYRLMAADAVDAAVKVSGVPFKASATDGLALIGSEAWTPNYYIRLVQEYGLEVDVAQHLSHTYGSRAWEVADLERLTGRRYPVVGRRLVPEYPYLESEVDYAIREYACTAVDVLARRTRLAFQNTRAAEAAIPRIIELMAARLGWDKARQAAETASAMHFLTTMGGAVHERERVKRAPMRLSFQRIQELTAEFKRLDLDNDGHIRQHELRAALQRNGVDADDARLRAMIAEADFNNNGMIELDEFLSLMSAVENGDVSTSTLTYLVESKESLRRRIPVSRSGGGV
jgi:glycerol-3-phosphate dehydrogenase